MNMQKKLKGKAMTIDGLALAVSGQIDGLALAVSGQIEELAVIVSGQFERLETKVDKRFEEVGKHFEYIAKQFERIHEDILELSSKTGFLDREISAIKHHLVYKEDFDDLAGRVKYLEKKMGVVSGK